MRREAAMKRSNKSVWLLSVIFVTACLFAGAQPIKVTVNGERVRFAGKGPREVDGRVLVPLRGVLEKAGVTVDWDAQTQTVLAGKDSQELELPIGSRTAKLNRDRKSVV